MGKILNKAEREKMLALQQADQVREYIQMLKGRWYTPPCQFGLLLANSPRHAHAGGRRVRHVTNFARKGMRFYEPNYQNIL